MADLLLQAEDALFVGPLKFAGNQADGGFYVDYQNLTGDFIEWTANVPTAGDYVLDWRYANDKTTDRPLKFDVNGVTVVPSLSFIGTGSLTVWVSVKRSVTLNAGSNKIRLTAIGSSGHNFDSLTVSSAIAPTVTVGDAIAVEGLNPFLVFDVSLSAPSNAPITLRLATTDGTAKGGLTANFPANLTGNLDYANQGFEVSTNGGTTWQAATNGTDVTFAIGQTALKVRLAVNDDTAEEGTTPETMTLRVASVPSGTVGNFADTGTGSITDNDTAGPITYQAENASFSGPIFVTGQGSEGTGYVDYQNSTGDFIEWTVSAPTAGSYDLSWRFANGSSNNRPLKLDVNGTTAVPSLAFSGAGDGNWANWRFVNQAVTLNAGSNKIKLTAIGSSGANFDYLKVSPTPVTVPTVVISNAAAIEGEDPFLIFDVSLSGPSNAPITLRLATTDGTAKGGLIANFPANLTGNLDYANKEFEFSTNGGITWQAATNGTDITFATGQTSLKVRLAVNDDTAVEGTTPETLILKVASVPSGTVNDFSNTGTGIIYDNDSSGTATYQAENASFVGPIVVTGQGSEGTGYVDYQNPTGDFIEWTVFAPTAGSYDLSWRFANGSSNNRPLKLDVNGTTTVPSLAFSGAGDGNWANWRFVNQAVTLNAGSNKIKLTAIGSSGANFDYLNVSPTGVNPVIVEISNANATEGATNSFLVFDLNLSDSSTSPVTLRLATTDGTAKGGLIANFPSNLSGNLDYAKQEYEFSTNAGANWQAAANGTDVTFAAGQTALKVRLAVNNDIANEGAIPETMFLKVASVLSGKVDDITDTGTGKIIDNDVDPSTVGSPISLLPYTAIRVNGTRSFDFNGNDGGLIDNNGDSIGFTMVDPAANPGNPAPDFGVVGYWPDKLDIVPGSGVLKITTTPGIQFGTNNSVDNALGVGLNVPSKAVTIATTLLNLPTPVGGNAQAGLWFGKADGGGLGSSQDNYIKFVVVSNPAGNYFLQSLWEQNGTTVGEQTIDIPDNPSSVSLSLSLDPLTKSVSAQYSLNGGVAQSFNTFSGIDPFWFSFDQQGINPLIGTRSFGGIFATNRTAPSPQVFTFDNFTITESDALPPPSPGALTFDRWKIPINNPTAMATGPDGKLYVATLLGKIYALTINQNTRTFTTQEINTITNSEGGPRLTLGIAIDPASTTDNVILWVAHSDGDLTDNAKVNTSKVSKLSGPGFNQKQDIITGLPRSFGNHSINEIKFGPDGKLYMFQGGNTGAGGANDNLIAEFGDRPEQVLSAAVLVADVKNPNFIGDAASNIGEFKDQFYTRLANTYGSNKSFVQIYASGLRNTYSGVFHSNGNLYAPNNGLGAQGTIPPVGPTTHPGVPINRTTSTVLGTSPLDDPGIQPDDLDRIVQGGYYGHPNPYRDEVVFKDGSLQGFNTNNLPPGHPAYTPPLFNLGFNKSANGIIEYTANNFFGAMKGNLLLTNFSQGDNITRLKLSSNGLSVVDSSDLIDGFTDPLPIEMGPNGSIYVGEFNDGSITILDPLGIWRTDLPKVPQAILDAGSATLNGNLYMIGGKTDLNGTENHIKTSYVYKPGNPLIATDDVWSPLGVDLPGPAVENPAVVTFNGKIYVFGGQTQGFGGSVNNAAVLTPDTNPDPNITTPTWATLAAMPTPVGGSTAQVLGSKIYVIGGQGINGASVNTVQIYDPTANSWSTAPSMGTRRDNPGSAVINNKLYVFGGRIQEADGTQVNPTLNTMEIFDPLTGASGTWTAGASMPTGRRTMAVGTLNGKFQVIGGEKQPDGSAFNQNEEYNPLTNSWRTLPSIPTPRHGSAFGTIDNVIYVAGGGPIGGFATTDVVQAFTF